MRRSYIIWFAIVLHAVWGGLTLSTSEAHNNLNLDWMVGTFSATGGGVILIAAAILATWGLWYAGEYRTASLVALLPQQAILVGNSVTLISATITGVIPEVADQIPRSIIAIAATTVWTGTVMHTAAILDYHGVDVWKTLRFPWRR